MSIIAAIRRSVSNAGHWASAHKVWTFVILVVVFGAGWWAYGATHPTVTQTKYFLGAVGTNTIISTVSGSGQVSATDQVNVEAKVSSTVTAVDVKAGDKVGAGQVLIRLDDTTAEQSLSDAQKSLAASELQYQKDSAQAPISYQDDTAALTTAQQNLQDTYNSTYNDLTSTYLDMPAIMTAANNTLYGYNFDPKKSQWNMDFLYDTFSENSNIDPTALKEFQNSSISDYNAANSDYTASLATYQQTARTASTDTLDSLLASSVTTMTDTAQALQTELNFLGTASDLAQTYNINLPSSFSTLQSTARSELSTANGDLSTLLADQKSITNAKQTITTDQQNITLDQVGNPDGTNPISLQIEENNIEQSKENIANEQTDLADYTITAPFDGTISAVNVKVGDNASGAVATIVSSAQIATLSLNEVDAAKIAVGDNVTMTFDAIDGLTLTGTVAEIDPVGTVSQGVVSYGVQVAFTTQDPRVRPGMTVDADIQTEVDENVLTVPSTAIKTVNGSTYVQAFMPPIATSTVAAAGTQGIVSDAPPQEIPVVTGISDSTNTEITSGLTEGEQIVTRTTTGAAVTTSAATSAAGAAGAARGGGGLGGGGAAIRL